MPLVCVKQLLCLSEVRECSQSAALFTNTNLLQGFGELTQWDARKSDWEVAGECRLALI